MAFTDPESNTGCLVPSARLAQMGHDPETFFAKTVFTGSHDRSILAVAVGAVDCAAVDSLVWDSNLRKKPSLAQRVKVVWRSEPFGPPPIVVPASLPEELTESLRHAFLTLHEDEEGRDILEETGIARFVPPRPESYKSATDVYSRARAGVTAR